MKIIITGSNGFLGTYICHRLKEDHDIIGIGTKATSSVSEIQYYQRNIESKNFVEDISREIKSCDIVIHLAAYIDNDNFNDKLIDVNCKGTLNILELSKELNAKKIIHSSSLPVIGRPKYIPITEKHQTNPSTLYHATKLMSEYIINLSSQYNIKPINLRIPSPIGIGMNENTILPIILKKCLRNEDIIIYGGGSRKQNYIDVRDITDAIVTSVDYDIEGNFNITSDVVISNIELAKLCIEITGSSSKIIFNDKEDSEENYIWEASIKKAKDLLSFEPQYSIRETIVNLISYWKEKI